MSNSHLKNTIDNACREDEIFLTAGQLAKFLGIKPRTIVRSWIPCGLPYRDFGFADSSKRRCRFLLSEVRAWIDSRHVGKHPSSPAAAAAVASAAVDATQAHQQ